MASSIVVGWLVSLMVQAAPPDRLAAGPQLPGWEETAEDKLARYTGIAEDLERVVYSREYGGLFSGTKGRAQTALLVLGGAFHESGFAKDVDHGPCYRGKDGRSSRCDGGASACLMQVRVGEGTTLDGWTRAELFESREKCFRAGLRLLRRSLVACSRAPLEERLSAYATGGCGVAVGMRKSRELFGQARQFGARREIPLDGVSMLTSLAR